MRCIRAGKRGRARHPAKSKDQLSIKWRFCREITMITSLELGNIRVFEGTVDWKFPLSRMTVLCGTNSAGKSTVFKSLLLLMQTQAANDAEPWSGRLRLSGPFV